MNGAAGGPWMLLVIAAVCLLESGCRSIGSNFTRVRNGTQIEVVSLPIDSVGKIVVPSSWNIKRSRSERQMTLRITKQQNYFGFPSERITIDNSATVMGVVQNVENGTLNLRHYGDFQTGDGGTTIAVEIELPHSMLVETIESKSVPLRELQASDVAWEQLITEIEKTSYH